MRTGHGTQGLLGILKKKKKMIFIEGIHISVKKEARPDKQGKRTHEDGDSPLLKGTRKFTDICWEKDQKAASRWRRGREPSCGSREPVFGSQLHSSQVV